MLRSVKMSSRLEITLFDNLDKLYRDKRLVFISFWNQAYIDKNENEKKTAAKIF